MKIFFEYFQIQKWMLQTVRAEKVDEKMGSFVQCFFSELSSLNCQKSAELTSAGNLSLLKKFTYMHLKWPIPHFQKMMLLCYDLLFRILGFEVEEFLLSQQLFRYFDRYYLMNGGTDSYKSYHFLKENFQMHICKLLSQT